MRLGRRFAFMLAATTAACGDAGGGPSHVTDASATDAFAGDADASVADAAQSPDATIGDAASTDSGFAPVPGFDPGGLGRRVGQEFYVAAQTLLTDGDGASWLLWRSYDTPTFTNERVHLDRFDADGVFLRSSALELRNPEGVVLHGDGTLTAFKRRCGPKQEDSCFYRDDYTGDISEIVWPIERRQANQYHLDDGGNVVKIGVRSSDTRVLQSAVGQGDGLYTIAHHGGLLLSRLDAAYAARWSVELLPWVMPPEVPPNAPVEELLRAADLARQLPTSPVAVADGVVVAATVARGTLTALAARGVELPKPADARCADVIVILVGADGRKVRHFAVPTPTCEALPKLTVIDNHAVVATVVSVDKPPEPNDTFQYDIGLAIVNLATGETHTRLLAMREDDWVHALAPCGPKRVCLAGVTGARSVNTGSTVTYGEGFVLPVSLTGEPEAVWKVTSARHSEILHLSSRPGGLVFFATVDGPITHTADSDPWLGFNKGMLGTVGGP